MTMPSSIVSHIGFAYDSIYDGTYHAAAKPKPQWQAGRPQSPPTETVSFHAFVRVRRFPPTISVPGVAFRMPCTLRVRRSAHTSMRWILRRAQVWDVSAVGIANWENAALIDTGTETHVGLIVSSDVGSGAGDYIRLYVGGERRRQQ